MRDETVKAKQNGLLLVSFDIASGPGEIIKDGVNGLLVKWGDVDALAEAMCKMIETLDARKRMAAASQIDLDKFSKDVILKQWTELLEL